VEDSGLSCTQSQGDSCHEERVDKKSKIELKLIRKRLHLKKVKEGEKDVEKIAFAKYDMDSGFVYAWTDQCNLILIDCDSIEATLAGNMYQRSELDRLIYEDPRAYADLVWNECPDIYLKESTDYTRLSDLR